MSVGPGTAVRERPVHAPVTVQITEDLAARLAIRLAPLADSNPDARAELDELVNQVGEAVLKEPQP